MVTGGGEGTQVPDRFGRVGKPDASILMHRLQSNDLAVRMPNIGNRIVHHEAVDQIRRWIQEMEAAPQKPAP